MNPLSISWKDIGADLDPHLIAVLESQLGFHTVMPVQKAVVPLLLKNYDVAVESCTGSGKTLAFLVPVLNKLLCEGLALKAKSAKNGEAVRLDEVRCLILSPTRELAIQIHQVTAEIAQGLAESAGVRITAQLLIGGDKASVVGSANQKPPSVLVATPGRLRELLYEKQEQGFTLNRLEFLILDEADRLIEGNHRFDVKDILSRVPKQRRTGLFSATLNNVDIKELIKLGLRNPAKVRLKNNTSGPTSAKNFSLPLRLKNSFLIFNNRLEKILFLHQRLPKFVEQKAIIFFNTCHSVDFYAKLMQHCWPAIKIWKLHGQMDQSKRSSVFSAFGEAKSGVLITTDVMARGVDFEGVSTIYQIDPPQNPEYYIHRIGRTARGIATGKAYLLLETAEKGFVDYLESHGLALIHKPTPAIDLGLEAELKEAMLTDKDFLMKAKRAFISFLRSYKEHLLQDVFEFARLDISQTSKSFFVPIIPKVQELARVSLKRVLDEDYWQRAQQTAFLDENQEKQFREKEVLLLQKRETMEKKKEALRKRAEKEQSQKKKRGYSDRKKAKEKEAEREFEELARETLLARKLKKGRISEEEYDRAVVRLDKRFGNVSDF